MQVPFFFKEIVDSMNVDFLALGGTVWTAAGAVVIACMYEHRPSPFLTRPLYLAITPNKTSPG